MKVCTIFSECSTSVSAWNIHLDAYSNDHISQAKYTNTHDFSTTLAQDFAGKDKAAGALPTSRRIAFWTESTPSLSNTLPAWVGCYALGASTFPYGFSKPKNLNFGSDAPMTTRCATICESAGYIFSAVKGGSAVGDDWCSCSSDYLGNIESRASNL